MNFKLYYYNQGFLQFNNRFKARPNLETHFPVKSLRVLLLN